MTNRIVLSLVLAALVTGEIFAQDNAAVPLTDGVYALIEQAAARGLVRPPAVRPFSRRAVREALREILSDENSRLSQTEILVLREALLRFEKKEKSGLDLRNLKFYFTEKTNAFDKTLELYAAEESEFSGAYYMEQNQFEGGFYFWLQAGFLNGIGDNFSIGASIAAGLIYANTNYLGNYSISNIDKTKTVNTFSEPAAFLPNSFNTDWDHAVWNLFQTDAVDDVSERPEGLSFAYATNYEASLSFFADKINLRLGRFKREYGASSAGNSLVLNQNAAPFFGIDVYAPLFSFLSYSGLTGTLEYAYHDGLGRKSAPFTFQNLYSISQFELYYKQYVSFVFGSAVVWPKRFELGYLFPFADKLFYQNNSGDYDSAAVFAALELCYPKIGRLWLSLFADEFNMDNRIFELDREQFAFQIGAGFNIPHLSFARINLIYTKIEPYCYTHNTLETPWYGESKMEEAFLNHGKPLGYYLKPNSDELKLNFSFMPRFDIIVEAQYSLSRHGADYGSGAVDGSSFYSGMDGDRNNSPELRKAFLRDGAYQWTHAAFAAITWKIPQTSISLSGKLGIVHSYFTNTDNAPNSGNFSDYHIIDTAEYPKKTGIVCSAVIKVEK